MALQMSCTNVEVVQLYSLNDWRKTGEEVHKVVYLDVETHKAGVAQVVPTVQREDLGQRYMFVVHEGAFQIKPRAGLKGEMLQRMRFCQGLCQTPSLKYLQSCADTFFVSSTKSNRSRLGNTCQKL